MKTRESLTVIHSTECWPEVDRLAPCEAICPLSQDVPNYVMAIAQGKFAEALDIIRETNPLPSVCGRVCHHPCETECNRGLIDHPIAIMWLKRLATDYGQKHGYTRKRRPPRQTRKEKVAIIGSGPAGLTAAYDLVKKGYGVTIFEAGPVAGGMLATGIPEFVLPQNIVQADIQYIKDLGVEIKTNTPIGMNLTIEELKQQGYNAILVAIGAWKNRKLDIPGAELDGVISALPFLKETKLRETENPHRKLLMPGKVVVIGGGDVAIDAARSALRLGADEVNIYYRRSRDEMPVTESEYEQSLREGVKVNFLVAPIRITSQNQKVTGLQCIQMSLGEPDESGRRQPVPITGSEFSVPADSIIVAIGQEVDLSSIGDIGLGISPGKAIAVDPDTMATNLPGIFAAGDVVTVAGTVTEAMAAGRKAAESVLRFLQGRDLKKGRVVATKPVIKAVEEMIPWFLVQKTRWDMPSLSPEDAIRTFKEVKLGYTEWEGIEEAKRCLNCRMCGTCLFDLKQLCFERGTNMLYD